MKTKMIEITMVVKATYEVYGGEYVDGPSPAHDAASLLLFAIETAVNDGAGDAFSAGD